MIGEEHRMECEGWTVDGISGYFLSPLARFEHKVEAIEMEVSGPS